MPLGAFQMLLPLIQKLGMKLLLKDIDSVFLTSRFEEVRSIVAARMTHDGQTPASLSGTPDERRQLIRTAEYLLWKEVLVHFTANAKGVSILADAIRDKHDDKVVPLVESRGFNSLTTVDHFVGLVIEAEIEVST